MTGPNMAAITASLERSLRNCSLDHHQPTGDSASGDFIRRSWISEDVSDATVELNSDASLPYHWEQCLDLETGEIYYINWRNGMKAKEDPRTAADYNGDYYSEDDESCYDSEESSSGSSPSSAKEHYREEKDNVLVVAGCKSCLMYFMVPKQGEDCPKCRSQLLHFDRSEDTS